MNQHRWLIVDNRNTTRLRKMLEETVGPAAKSAIWVLGDEHRWACLCWIADHYAHSEPNGETWRDAERQWLAVRHAARNLNVALQSLGNFASAIRLDAGIKAPGLWEKVSGYLHPVPGEAFAPPVHDLEWFADVALNECRRMKVETNGARKGDESGALAFMIHQLLNLLEVPKRPMAHVRKIAAVIHAWATGDKSAMNNPRFGERAAKQVRVLQVGPRSPS